VILLIQKNFLNQFQTKYLTLRFNVENTNFLFKIMSKKIVGYLQRYEIIIRQIRNNRYISLDELINAVQTELAFYGDKIGVQKRTIQRDMEEIGNIKYSKLHNGYYFPDDVEGQSDIEMWLEPLNLLKTICSDGKLPNFVFPEKRKPKGMEHLPMLIYAIKNNFITEFFYRKFDNSSQYTRCVEPYAIKEFRGRWYLLAVEINGKPDEEGSLKTWGIDRIQDLVITKDKFQKSAEYDIEKGFANSFGIYSDKDKEVEEVIISFSPMGGKYNESFPLHPSQETLINDENEYRIRLKIKITYDFIMELLSQSQNMVVISPLHLRNQLIDIHRNALKMMESIEEPPIETIEETNEEPA